jgi:hypothetical protein
MKIQEIAENIVLRSKKNEFLIIKLFQKSVRALSETQKMMRQLRAMPNKSLNNEQWQTALQYLDTIIGAFDRAVTLFASYQMNKNTFDETNLEQTLKDILLMRNAIHKLRNQLPNSLLEDIDDFKAANGQLSAMGTKKSKTKKDSAKNKVEQ